MMSKLFGRDGQRREKHEITPSELRALRGVAATSNITSVAVPKYRVRGSFVEYVIECTKRNATWQVFRRYQQFKTLDQKLKQLCPMSSQHHCEYGVLPVLAGSHWTEVTNQSVDLVEKRRRYLEIYLEQLLVPRNLFYVARTVLYDFLHDGEVPVRYKANIIQPLIGFAMPPQLQQEKEGENKGENGVTTPIEELPQPVVGSSGINNNNKDTNSMHTTASGVSEKVNSTSPRSSLAAAAASITDDGDDAPSNGDTDAEDVRLPTPSRLCLQCNAEFSSVLYPHRCFSCKQQFCRNCLRRMELEDGGKVKACMQCYENYERHQQKKRMEKGPGSPTSVVPPKDTETPAASTVCESPLAPLCLDGTGLLRTDVSLKDFELVTTLGRGTFGKVIKVIFREDGKVYAMKVLNKCIIHKRRMIEYIKEEKNIMATLPPHPYVVKCHFAFQTDYHLFFVLDYLPGGELYSHVYPKCTLGPEDVRLYIAEIVLALQHLHRYDIVHRDVKLENIVLGADGHLKLTDFGLARTNFSRHRRCSFVGSAEYLAPETIQGESQTKALDWWSVGVMLYEMLFGKPPFHAANNKEVYDNILYRPLDFTAPCFTPEATSLIQQLLQRPTSLRLSDPESIKAHPYFAPIDWEALEKKSIPAPFRPRLDGNDTRYFKREYTAEWAVIPKPVGVSRATLDVLTSRFSNFVHVSDEEADVPLLENKNQQLLFKEDGEGVARSLLGVWRVMKVEMMTADGKVAYPWGSEVRGLLAYFPDGLFTLQLAPINRRNVRPDFVERATKEELVEAYSSYTASFGRWYQAKAGGNVVVHCPSGSLCPNLTRGSQKYYFEVGGGRHVGDAAVLKLYTATQILRDERLLARTVLTWERISSC